MLVAAALNLLVSRDQLQASGLSNRAIARDLAAGALHKVHTGWFVRSADLKGLHTEERHLLSVVAAHKQMRYGGAAFVLQSAAALWQLPLFRTAVQRVHVGGPSVDGRNCGRPKESMSRPLVARHEVALPATDRAEVDGIPCTSLERTVFDLMRLASREAAVSVADAALRRVAWDSEGRNYGADTAAEWRALMDKRIRDSAGARGIRQARFVVRFADGRSHLPGESVSRLYLHDLGFAPPRLQVPISGPNGVDYLVDFGLDDVDAWGEFDGAGKYIDDDKTGGRSPLEVLKAEKQRQDWIHGRTGRRFVRWGNEHLRDAATLGARLAEFHIRPAH